MTSTPAPSDGLDRETVSRYLELARGVTRRPVDDLIDALEAHGDVDWLIDLLARGPLQGMASPVEALVEGPTSLDTLVRVKERSKEMMDGIVAERDRLAALAAYFLSIAAGLRFHETKIGGRDAESLRSALLDLATAAPAPFDELLGQAASVLVD